MKNVRITSILVLLAALGTAAAVPASAAPKDAAIGYWARQITVTSWNVLRERSETNSIFEGASRRAVISTMGEPAQRLSQDVWVYDDFAPDLAEARQRGCNILVVTFVGEKLATMKFVNTPAEEKIAAAVKAGQSGHYASDS
ncbi:MAG TPA: hypothetical protein VLT83_16930 [Opitutaceae bacterium]|nr:hypothetical protein [Opitutaceae bacterium]